jgi:hypothetical protein
LVRSLGLRTSQSLGSLQKHSGANDRQIVELHMRDTAVFVSLSSRTNTRQGLRLCLHLGEAPTMRGTEPLVVRGL